ncbi:MAG: hypothetical protein J6X50_00440 [Bacilli bacterium]|nr:hypothetical protein [Bacilli bacterium]
MKHPLLLALSIIGICLFVSFYFVSRAFYFKRHQVKYHFFQMFPYEFNYPNIFKENLYGNIIFVLSCLSIIAFYINNPLNNIYSLLGIILSIVLTMMYIILLLLPLRYLRTQMIVSSISMALSTALPVLNLFAALNLMKSVVEEANPTLCIISMVISGIIGLMMLLLILNPKLTFNIYYEKAVDADGNEIKKRPKVILMALNEWWAIFTFFLTTIPLILLFL